MKAAQLRQSILQAAVQGKLVPQNPHDEPADKLLERIRTKKVRLVKEGKIKKDKPLPPITEDDVPYDLPDGWVWCRLGTVAIHCLGKMLDQQKNIGIEQHYLRNLNVQWFRFDLSDLKKMKIDQSEHERYLVKKGDLIICEGGYPGTSAIWDSDNSIFLQKALHRVRFFAPDMNRFFHYVLYYSSLSGELSQYFTGSGIQHFTGQSLGKFLFPLPPLAEQQRIVAKVDELMALCDELEAAEKELDKLEADFAEYLPKSILQAAVQGKLVPQNVHDEPASELLKCIQQEKARLAKEGKIKKEKPLPPITKDEIPYDLPDGWVWCRLGEAHSICRGITFPATVKHKTFVEGTICCATTGSVQKEYNPNADVFVPEQYVKNENQWLQRNDIIMSTANSRELVGKTCMWKGTEKKTFGGFLTVIRPEAELNPMYSYYVLQHLWADGAFNVSSTQTTNIANINNEILMNTIMPLPPLSEQQCIVAKVDELMALCDELKAARDVSIKPVVSNVVPFPQTENDDEELLMVAQGEVSGKLSKELKQAQEDLFGDGVDE